MSISIAEADTYIAQNVIDTEGWDESDAAKRQRILNVAERTLTRLYSKYTIPNNAVYEFAASIATTYSDAMIQAQRGVQSLSVSGVISTSFRNTPQEIASLVPQSVRDIIGDANGVSLPSRRVGRLIP